MSYLTKNEFKRGNADNTLFFRMDKKHFVVALVYVNDFVFGSTNDNLAKSFADEMKKMFEMRLVGELTYFLGLQVKQIDKGIYINQAKYAKNLLKRFGLENVAHARTRMATNTKLGIDPSGQLVEIPLYRSMIDCLLYLIASHPDTSFSVGVCARLQANPKMSHLTVVKRIIKYVNGTSDLGFFYRKESNVFLARYFDANWAGNADDRKRTTGCCFYVGTNLVPWMSKKKNSISLSTVEAECIAVGSCCS